MKLEDLIQRADELIELGKTLSKSAKPAYMGGCMVDTEGFAEFRTASLSFINRVFGSESPSYQEFDTKVIDYYDVYVNSGVGILKACRTEMLPKNWTGR
jgi:hypothetical protein